ncbi:MAG: hypothetical protein Q8R92_04810, partial [Deltaproteobacteria bacterium]|nr:hypothetical protein [Deltaproteobacteria bacterium]
MRGLKYLAVWTVMIGTVVLAAATCTPTPGMVQRNPPGVMMRMMGMGDMANGLSNVNKLMPMPANERMAHMNKAETEALERGRVLFHDTKLGTS